MARVIAETLQIPLPELAVELLTAAGKVWGMEWDENKSSVVRHLLATCPSVLQVARTEFGMTPEDVLTLFAVRWGVRVPQVDPISPTGINVKDE